MAQLVDFASEAFLRDPQAGVALLRASGPVVATRFPIIGRVWVTTTYEAAARVLKDSSVFTLRREGGGLVGLPWWMPKLIGALANNMLTMDEPDHTRLRDIVDEAFRRRAVLDMAPHIRAIAEARNIPINQLAAEIDDGRKGDAGLASAIRVFVLDHCCDAARSSATARSP